MRHLAPPLRVRCALVVFLTSLLAPATLVAAADHRSAASEKANQTEALTDLAREVYQFAYPLVLMDCTRQQVTDVPDSTSVLGRAPINQFAHFRTYPTATDRDIVRFNFDTLYSFAWLDLSAGPIVLSVPDTGDRYYLIPALDMWTDVFTSIGTRTTGNGAGRFAFVPPGWQGEIDEDIVRLQAPSSTIWLMGRVQTGGPADYENVHRIQDGFQLEPLIAAGDLPAKTAAATSETDSGDASSELPPALQVHAMSGVEMFVRFSELMQRYPPRADDSPIVLRMRQLGLNPGQRWDPAAQSDAVLAAVDSGAAQALADIAEKMQNTGQRVHGWNLLNEFMGNYGVAYLHRAAIAMGGIGANLPEDSVYPTAFFDSEGQPLEGGNDYVVHFPAGQTPPAKAFWSITMYDDESFHIANPINRFAIGDRDDLKYNADGSLDIYIQSSSPGSERESNWLPSPERGRFSPSMRIYSPEEQVLDGTWAPPPIVKVSAAPVAHAPTAAAVGPAAAAVESNAVSEQEAKEMAHDAYVFAYPLLLMEATKRVGTNAERPQFPVGPINQIAHAREFPDDTFSIVVRPNADTLYSTVIYDVTEEPLVFQIPEASDRYYLLQFMDYWSDVFASPGNRTSGDSPQTFAIVGPRWSGQLPAGIKSYRSPTGLGMVLGRTQTNGKQDYEAVHRFQDAMRVAPLSRFLSGEPAPLGTFDPTVDSSPPVDQVERMTAAAFFESFAQLMIDNPPHANDHPMVDRLRRIGIQVGQPFVFADAPPAVQQALREAASTALPEIKQTWQQSGIQTNGWQINLTAIGTYGTDYLHRAGVAWGALGANVPEDAVYPTAFSDSDGNPLNSDFRYRLHFAADQLPPVRGFWSLSMYNERQTFAANAIDRFAIGDRDDLQFNADGSLDLYIQRTSPGDALKSNWLPTPEEGGFSLNLRLYWPHRNVLNGQWSPPPLDRIAP